MNNFNLKQIVDSGQVFRAWDNKDETYTFISADKKITLKQDEEIIDPYWCYYFDLNTDYSKFINAINSNNKYLTEAAKFGNVIRILNQDPWEMLISFIISQQNNIPRIKSIIEKLCKLCGNDMGDYYAFPTPIQILALDDIDLDKLGLGYRKPYLQQAAFKVLCENNYNIFENFNTDKLYKCLLEFKGIGPKVANCVMLFGYHRIEAFPIDVWIKRIIDREYKGFFDTSKYNGFVGILQQYMFYYERNRE